MKGILSCESGELFMKYLSEMFQQYTNTFAPSIPYDFLLNYLSGSLANAIQWWIQRDMKNPPEEIAKYYMALVKL